MPLSLKDEPGMKEQAWDASEWLPFQQSSRVSFGKADGQSAVVLGLHVRHTTRVNARPDLTPLEIQSLSSISLGASLSWEALLIDID